LFDVRQISDLGAMGKNQSLLMKMGYGVFAKVRARLAKDAGGVCYYCGVEVVVGKFGGWRLATIDHKTPLSRGGSWKRYNLVCACRKCNNLKADMTAEEFMALPAYLREVA
jgi:5-methylcytosine-specific restriction endonuclease McrA